MFYKLINFTLVYILSIFNFAIILSPLMFFAIPMILASEGKTQEAAINILFLVFFIVSVVMIFVMFLDLLFGFSSRKFLKTAKDFRTLEDYRSLENVFEDLKYQFDRPNVKLYIDGSDEVNAFAVGNMGRQYIVVTKGIILKYLLSCEDREKFHYAMKAIMGHEMSHLVNKDYLPGLLLTINEQATEFVSAIIFNIFNIFIRIISIVPIVGNIVAHIILIVYKLFDFVISFFYKYVILTIYSFIQLKISRSQEYRCDAQSAKSVDGVVMAGMLSYFGESSFTTIFSTHPKTSSRIQRVVKIKKTHDNIFPVFGNRIINTFYVLLIVFLPFVIMYYTDVKGLINNYNDFIFYINSRINGIKYKIHNLVYNHKF